MRPTLPVLLLAAAAAAALPPAAAAQTPCPANATIQRVMVTLADPEPAMRMSIRRPYKAEQPAASTADQRVWRVDLRAPAPLGAIEVEPLKDGSVATPTGQPWTEMRGGRCVAHFGFRFQKAWRVEIESDPANLPVQVLAANGVFAQRTGFVTSPLPPGPLKLRIVLAGEHTLPLTVRPEQFHGGAAIRHDNRGIKRLLCGALAGTDPNACTFRFRKVTTREIRIRRVDP